MIKLVNTYTGLKWNNVVHQSISNMTGKSVLKAFKSFYLDLKLFSYITIIIQICFVLPQEQHIGLVKINTTVLSV